MAFEAIETKEAVEEQLEVATTMLDEANAQLEVERVMAFEAQSAKEEADEEFGEKNAELEVI